MSSFFKSVVRVAAPIIGTALGGPLGGALGGAIGGAATGGGLKGALTGGLGGSLYGGAGSLGSAASGALGLSGAASSVLAGATSGAGIGLASGGDLKSALTGGLTGGIGGYTSSLSGGVPSLGNSGTAEGLLNAGTGAVNGFSTATRSGGLLSNLTSGLGLSGGGGSSSLSGVLGGGSMNPFKLGASLYSNYSDRQANDEIIDMLRQKYEQGQGYLSPYQESGQQANTQLSQALAAGFNPSDLENDPSYQFRLQQGQNALTRSLGASGLSQSGAALKAAQDYGQGMASNEYQNAYGRWLAQNQQLAGLAGQGYGAAQDLTGLSGDLGAAEAAIIKANQESKNKLLSGLLGGY